jgi:hypothetical protein
VEAMMIQEPFFEVRDPEEDALLLRVEEITVLEGFVENKDFLLSRN